MELQLRGVQGIINSSQNATTVRPSYFTQQGTVDWPTLANASITASVSFLTRLSGCGVELWTAAVAQVVLGEFQLSSEGESRVNKALSKLHSFGSYGNAMYFGFGIKHMIRTLAESREGMATIALCASLTEVHGMTVSTQVISEYTKLHGADSRPDLLPSFRQWNSLLESCSGILATSPFDAIVEFFMSFHPQLQSHSIGNPTKIALALEGLAKLSNGSMKSMTLVGNSECGFFAALAHWLLNLRVVVQNVAGAIVYPSPDADNEDFQLLVVFSDDPHAEQSVARTANTYYIEGIVDILETDTYDNGYYLSGRVEWNTAFKQVFGSSVANLLEVPNIVGDLIGSAARMYIFVSQNPPPEYNKFRPESAGRGFVDLLLRQLPEFRRSKPAMEAAVERSHEDAILHFENSMVLLKKTCGCHCRCSAEVSMEDQDDSERSNFSENIRPVLSNGKRHTYERYYCLQILALTAIQLIRQLSIVGSMPTGLCPKRRGLEQLYNETKAGLELVEHTNDVYGSIDSAVNIVTILDGLDLLELVSLVFGTRDDPLARSSLDADRPSVMVNGGLCFIHGAALHLSDNLEEMLSIYILPGHIEMNGRSYTRVRDGKNGVPTNILSPFIFPAQRAAYDQQMCVISSMTARAVVNEALHGLRLSYEIRTTIGTYFVGPRRISDDMTAAANSISCDGRACQPFDDLAELFSFTLFPMRLPYEDALTKKKIPRDQIKKPNISLFGDRVLARCSAVDSTQNATVILQGRECISCCAREALKSEFPDNVAIISRLSVQDMQRVLGDEHPLILRSTN